MRTVLMALTIALVVPDLAGTGTYVYKYEALLFSGLYQEGLARAGIKINSKVLISAAAENAFFLKLSKPQLFEYSGIWPTDTFVTSKLTSELSAQLQIPIKFEYTNGKVGRIFTPSVVPTTVINLHRGILNILQLNLKKTQNIYEVQEDGVQGICETQYLISEDEENNHTIITKSRDLTLCQERIMKDVGLTYIEKCIECQQREKSLSGVATYSYTMKPTTTGVVFTEATVQEIHQFTPHYEIGDATQMETIRQTWTFLEIMASPIIPISAEYLARGSLQYEFSTETLWSPIQLMRISNPQAQIVDALNHLATKKLEEVHEDVPLKYIQLIQLMRFASADAVEGIWSQFKTRPNFRKWILDAVPAVGTLAALKFIKKIILADELSIPEFTQVLLAAVHMVTANLDTIKMYSGLALSHKVQETPVLRDVAMLGYGTMINRYCGGALECPVEILKPIHEIVTEVTAETDIAEITLILKVLGNAGHPASIKYITKFLPLFGNQIPNFPLRVQVGAVLALKAVAKKEPKLVQNVVLQIFVNKDLHPELRMVSWIVLFETKPGMGLVITLARALSKEPNLQVASLVYSHMKALTRSTSPEFALIAAACNVAIRILSPKLDKLSFLYSKAIFLDGYEPRLMVGAVGSAFIINDVATVLPRAVVAKARAYLAGAATDVIEVSSYEDAVGIRTDGIQEALLKSPFLKDEMQPRMKQVLKALTAFKALPKKQPLGSIYVKLLGQEIAFANVGKAVLEQATQLGGYIPELAGEALKAMQNGIAFKYAKPLLVAEVRRIFPSVAGVPMEFSLYTAAVAAANLKDVKLTAEILPSIALQTFAVMGLNTGFIQAASMARGKISTCFPLKVEAKFDIPNANFKIKVFPIVLPVHAVTARIETLAVTRNIKEVNAERITPIVPKAVVGQHSQESENVNHLASVMPPAEEPELRTSTPVHRTLCSVVPHIGVKACMEIMSCNADFIKNTTLYNMIGQHGGLELEVQLGPRAAKKLLKEINIVDAKTPKFKIVLQKLKEILEGGQRNNNSRFFNHNVLFYTRSTSSRSIRSSSSVRSSNPHLSKELSSGQNSERFKPVKEQAVFLGESLPPVFAIIARVVRVDRKLLGYQLVAYLDRLTSRVQIIVVSIAVKDNWKMCANSILLSKQEVAARIAWGAECQQYAISINAGAGNRGPSPMAYLKVKCEKVPTIITKSLAEYIPGAAQMTGLAISDEKNIERQIELVILVPTERTLDIIIKTPTMTLSKSNLVLPIALTFEAVQANPEEDVINIIRNLYIEASSAKCSKVRNTLTTFNHRIYNYVIPLSCYQVLVQDCTSEHKFIVLIKKENVFEHEDLNIKVADIDVNIYHKRSAMKVKMNGIEVPTTNISYQHPTGSIRIEKKGQGIALYAPSHGLQEVYCDTDQWKIYVADWMKGQTCGLCGMADGEIVQNYRTPSGYLTKSSVSFVHSWVLPAESCHDAGQCHMKLETVELEKQKSDRQESKCYSVEPVLRCLPGCLPIRTSHITVGYYCLPSNLKSNLSANLSSNYEKTEDLIETAEAHVACYCTEECV
ncbi:vitellogenin [Chanodichthys erythropterus]|uniref:vitellogenin n=1 Tax=Chanodichthys erythropterus TaxID=933992 RepID=UPI00351F63CA